MSLSSLQALADNRDALLLAEVAALLHDVGKLSSRFIDQMSADPSSLSQDFEHESAITQQDFVNAQFVDVLKQRALRDKLRLSGISNNEQLGQPLDLILHHDKARHSAFLVRLLNRCDGSDSGADKGTTRQEGLPKETKQQSANTFIATAFGYETQKIDPPGLDKVRVDLTSKLGGQLSNITSQRSAMLEQVKPVYAHSLAETRRSANDVTLWCHSFSVATLYKTSLATFLLNGALDIDHLRWRLLRVNFDVLGLYAKAVKIADLLGYQRAVEEACTQIKQLVEEEYPLGNEVYRDTTGIYFTFPDLDLPADLAQEIRRLIEKIEPELAPRIAVTVGDGQTASEQLKGILAKARKEALQELAQPFDSQNLSVCWQQQWEVAGQGHWELCPVCRLRPMREGREACEPCQERRTSRIQQWQQNPDRTIWIDELADHNGRVALIVGKFGLDDWLSGDLVQTMLVRAEPNNPSACTPKNPSPARLRRVWETCQRFWTETVEEKILANHEYGKDAENAKLRCVRRLVIPDKKTGWKENVPYDGTVNGKPISLLWREDVKHFVTIINLQLTTELEKGQTITVSDPDEPYRSNSFEVQDVMKATNAMGEYKPFLSLLSSPDQFLVLVPAVDALKIASKIREEYQKQFGKVQNRLPLFLGLVFFPRKTPLVAVMDAARRMLETPLQEEQWQVECCRIDEHQPERYHLRLSQSKQQSKHRIDWQVPVKMGDNQTKDLWYPYFFVERFVDGTPDGRTYRFQRTGRWLVHVKELKEGDVVSVTPSRFAYLWLEHSAKRFEFDAQEDVLLLDELPRLTAMWEEIRKTPDMTDTKLRSVQALLEAKGAAWREISDEFKQLVQTTLKRAGMLDAVTPEDVISGRFARCLELHMKILKLRVKEVHHERESETATL